METLLEYAGRERQSDPWWEDVYQILEVTAKLGATRRDVLAARTDLHVTTAVVKLEPPVKSKTAIVSEVTLDGDAIVFTKQTDGTFKQEGEIPGTHGRFQWLLNDGRWDGGWAAEPIADLLARMALSGPYKYSTYRIIPAEKKELVIKPTCAGCGVIAGVDCQRTCEYLFGSADVAESLPIQFNTDHQFSLQIDLVTDGKNFGQKKPKTMWFNSVRCAELFLMDEGRCERASAAIGNGERLLRFLGGAEVVKARKKRAPNAAFSTKVASAA